MTLRAHPFSAHRVIGATFSAFPMLFFCDPERFGHFWVPNVQVGHVRDGIYAVFSQHGARIFRNFQREAANTTCSGQRRPSDHVFIRLVRRVTLHHFAIHR